MSLSRILMLASVVATAVVPSVSLADSDAEYRNAVSTFITLQGFECGSVLLVEQREEPNAFDVTCSRNSNGSGDQILYFFQLEGGGAVVKLQEN